MRQTAVQDASALSEARSATTGMGSQQPQHPSPPVGAWPAGQTGFSRWQILVQGVACGLGTAKAPMAVIMKVVSNNFISVVQD